MKKRTVCRLCSACCPILAEVEDGVLKSAERISFVPEAKRLRCPKLEAAPKIVYSAGRLTSPLIRERGATDGNFREASWDEALDLVAERFSHFKEANGPESVAWLRGMAADWGASWDYASRLMNLFGSPNAIGNGSVCHVAREMAHTYTYGAMTMPRAKESRCVVVWGKNDRNTAPGGFEAILHARKEGARLIVIDPVKTHLAEAADIWLPIRPGHDGYLAMAMIHEIIESSLYDRSFVEDHCVGFEELAAAARPLPPERVGPRIDLPPDAIRDAARLYASTRPACIVDGNGIDMQLQVFQISRAIASLRALTGNLDKKGGDFIPQPVPLDDVQLKGRLPKGTVPVTRNYPLFNDFHPTWGLHAQSCLIDAILDEEPYPIEMLLVQSGNPLVTMADSSRVEAAFDKLSFLVVIDPFMTRTAEMADVVLPATTCFEKTQLNRAFMRNSPVMLQEQVIDWVGESRPDWKIVFDLGRRLGFEEEFPWRTAEEAIDHQLGPSGISVQDLRDSPEGVLAEPFRFEKHLEGGFATPSGKVELYSDRLATAGRPPVPFMDGEIDDPISFGAELGEDALIGISGERVNRLTHTQFLRIPTLGTECGNFVDMHPEDARARCFDEGQPVRITTPRGAVRMEIRISDVVRPGVVRLAWGLGELDPMLGVNRLTDDSRRDPLTGTPSSRSFRCRIEPD